MAVEKIQVPDLGTDDTVEVIEVQIKVGDSISENDTLVVLESDKAAMDIPAPKAGVVKKVLVEVGAQVKTGTPLLELEAAGSDASAGSDDSADSSADSDDNDKAEESKAAAAKDSQSTAAANAPEPEAARQESKAAASGGGIKAVQLPDLGSDEAAEVIEVLVKVGDEVGEETGLITLETDKAAMDVPASVVGVIKALKVKVGDKVKSGDHIVDVELSGDAADSADTKSSSAAPDQQQAKAPTAAGKASAEDKEPSAQDKEPSARDKEPSARDKEPSATHEEPSASTNDSEVYAGPAVRKLARELGADLSQVRGSGLKGRIQKEDVHAYVKSRLQEGAAVSTTGSGIPSIADIDFSKFGRIEEVEMSKLQRVTAANMTKNWLNVPRVTHFDDADITELEEFREQQKKLAEKKGVKLTPLPFIVKACAQALVEHPQFNVSLHSSDTKLIRKHYVNIGVAVATPAGLMVPVIKNVDSKSIFEIANEIQELAAKAKDRKLSREDMEGACFTVSSLGNLGGTGFTPIINAPEIAILGVSRAAVKPVWNGKKFVPRTMLPFSLAYDHRAVNGVDGGMFATTLSQLLSDIRLLVL